MNPFSPSPLNQVARVAYPALVFLAALMTLGPARLFSGSRPPDPGPLTDAIPLVALIGDHSLDE